MVKHHFFRDLVYVLLLGLGLSLIGHGSVVRAAEVSLGNPTLSRQSGACEPKNLSAAKFAPSISGAERLQICRSLNGILSMLGSRTVNSPLKDELHGIWQTFVTQKVFFDKLAPDSPKLLLAQAEPFPNGIRKDFEAVVYVDPQKTNNSEFLYVLFHELRHVHDFEATWRGRSKIDTIELERRAFRLMSGMMEAYGDLGGTDRLPSLWKKDWCRLSEQDRMRQRNDAVENFLDRSKAYQRLRQLNASLDFTRLDKGSIDPDDLDTLSLAAGSLLQKEEQSGVASRGEVLPPRFGTPDVKTRIAQKIEELPFKLAKPESEDPAKVLQVALQNEKTLYFGMNNFVYDQATNVECWKKNKKVSTYQDVALVARTVSGKRLSMTKLAAAEAAVPCVQNHKALNVDFAETFWASPALEYMNIRFFGFVDEGGKRLARYTVLQPTDRELDMLRQKFPEMFPFRVFTGSIFVDPQDGQIIKFWGSAYPEKEVTGFNSKQVHGSYVTVSIRNKTTNGVWLPSFVGTVAVTSGSNDSPFRYSVTYGNYRQTQTEMQILDDEPVVRSGE